MKQGARIVVAAAHSGRDGGAEAHVLSSVDALSRAGYDVTLVVAAAGFVDGWGTARLEATTSG